MVSIEALDEQMFVDRFLSEHSVKSIWISKASIQEEGAFGNWIDGVTRGNLDCVTHTVNEGYGEERELREREREKRKDDEVDIVDRWREADCTKAKHSLLISFDKQRSRDKDEKEDL